MSLFPHLLHPGRPGSVYTPDPQTPSVDRDMDHKPRPGRPDTPPYRVRSLGPHPWWTPGRSHGVRTSAGTRETVDPEVGPDHEGGLSEDESSTRLRGPHGERV